MRGQPRRSPVLPVGTQVVLRHALAGIDEVIAQKGATGRVSALEPDGRYRIQLTDGRLVLCLRDQVWLRRAYQHDLAIGPNATTADGHDLVRRHTIYAAVVGSRAFGLDTDNSDVDTRGVYVAPTSAFWSLVKPPMHVEGPGPEWFSWEVERFCELALKANPNLLEVLHSPDVVTVTGLGQELLDLRSAFLSQLVYQTYSGYVLSQFRKLEADFRQHGAPKWKHVMHLIRLLIAARGLLEQGRLTLDVGDQRERLLAVRRGELPWDEVEAWRLLLHQQLDRALEVTPLPPVPDVERVDAWLRSVRSRSAAEDVK